MVEGRKARAVGINHIALEVGDIEEALAFYGRLFDFKLRGKSSTSAFIDLGDQFLALQKGRTQPALPFPVSSLIACSFFDRCVSPMPRSTFGALVNWTL